MTWQQYCALAQIPERYQEPDIGPKSDLEAYDYIKRWLDAPKRSMAFIGAPGRGKTYASYYIMRCLLTRNPLSHVRFLRSSDADQRMIEECRLWGSARHFIDTLCDVPILLLDDFGIECNSERMERNYYDLIDKRLAHDRPTIISTNVPINQFEQIFGSRIASRLQEYIKVPFRKGDLRSL